MTGYVIFLMKMGKTAESPTTILIQNWFKSYELKWGYEGLPPIIILIYINLVEYKLWCIPKHSRMLRMKLRYLVVVGDSAGGPENDTILLFPDCVKWI